VKSEGDTDRTDGTGLIEELAQTAKTPENLTDRPTAEILNRNPPSSGTENQPGDVRQA